MNIQRYLKLISMQSYYQMLQKKISSHSEFQRRASVPTRLSDIVDHSKEEEQVRDPKLAYLIVFF